jgi:hypothetical protein
MAADQPNYFMYFPTHYRWSAEILAMLSTAPYGGADISEVDRVGRELCDCVGDDDRWFRAWSASGQRIEQRAREAERSAHRFTASLGMDCVPR